MSIAQSMLAEFEAQAPATRKFIERLPQDKLTWQPHPRSRTAGHPARSPALLAPGPARAAVRARALRAAAAPAAAKVHAERSMR